MLRIERLTSLDGRTMAGFFVRNRANRVVAIGAFCSEPFVTPASKRLARDLNLCEAIAKLTGIPIKWNLSCYGNQISSGTPQYVRGLYRKSRRFGQ